MTLDSLYPFLYGGDGADVTEELRQSTRSKLGEIADLRERLLRQHAARLAACAHQMAGRLLAGGQVLAFGNGGSATDAQAIAWLFESHGLPARDLAGDPSLITALANDAGFEVIFSRTVAALAGVSDVAVALSTSGGSENVIRGLREAHRAGLLTVAFAGNDGGRLAQDPAVDFLFTVPSASVHRVQEAQVTLYHVLCELTLQAVGRA